VSSHQNRKTERLFATKNMSSHNTERWQIAASALSLVMFSVAK
jgi:hypothetical protein